MQRCSITKYKPYIFSSQLKLPAFLYVQDEIGITYVKYKQKEQQCDMNEEQNLPASTK